MIVAPVLVVLLSSSPAQVEPQKTVAAEVIILAGDERAEVAETQLEALRIRAREMRARGIGLGERYPALISSAKIDGLQPGFVVVLAGFCPRGRGRPVLERIRTLVPGAYKRKVKVPPGAVVCPTLTGTGALSDVDWAQAHLGPGPHGVREVAGLVRASTWIGETGKLAWGSDAACLALHGTSCAASKANDALCGPGTRKVGKPNSTAVICEDMGSVGGPPGLWLALRLEQGTVPVWFLRTEPDRKHRLNIGAQNDDVSCFEDTHLPGAEPSGQQSGAAAAKTDEHRLICFSRRGFKMVELRLEASDHKAPSVFPSKDYTLGRTKKNHVVLCTPEHKFRLDPTAAWAYDPAAKCQ